ncbi:MAE_28990/MAE_18760 family HEPN-like nuclease [Klebsiella aerogenes]|uniref:MAE_28990/MAE_18760 family HEPN-like nuclease n=1 Tax=Klebsiella aerogenes TaxID=548 RepID=UPI0012ACB218|nr:MAE_28990/MAE_18760 family HEPN-like nuclease [Klebsiella aerogenes]
MEIRTAEMLSRELTNELSWRTKEIIQLRMEAKAKEGSLKKTIIRSGVAISYSHWEGFVKNATEYFLNFLHYQKIQMESLKLVYVTHALKKEIHGFSETKDVDTCIRFLTALIEKKTNVAVIRHENYVDTESNLSSKVFDNIAKSIGVDTHQYKDFYPYIDESIVSARNNIAHGERLIVEQVSFEQLTEKVLALMNMYKNDIENIVVTKEYLISI